ncbi:type VI secretion system baseplate subunit TssK [Tatumella ptyseos]|uniref:type VI secretion system baseplate subunit TssK n=1 Tax=Tatumella ptyseos TaxID=82987 RepID=UPI0026EEF0CA|nr:type VI secretion system baseplate subunit TssK [Tatumella ptyseos]WKX27314.1 type VI secretion system baseplate subunit TssK [Tatumella ptyseos]
MKTNKVVWSEGLFLRPQLFQQQERYFEHFVHQRASILTPYHWGFSHLKIDQQALNYGKLMINSARGIFPDGTPFAFPEECPPPQPLTLQPQYCGQQLCIALPLAIPGHDETSLSSAQENSLARFVATEQLVHDSNAIHREPRHLLMAHLNLRLLPESELNDTWIGIPCTKLKHIESDGRAILVEEEFIPPIIDSRTSTTLMNGIQQIAGQLKHRADAFASPLSEQGQSDALAVKIEEYLLLQLCNRYQVILDYLLQRPLVHPENYFRELNALQAELATYLGRQRRPPPEGFRYQHKQLAETFRPLIDDISQQLNLLLTKAGECFDFQRQTNGIWVTSNPDLRLEDYQSIIVAVKASVPHQQIINHFIQQSKVSAPRQIFDLVRSHLPGVALQLLGAPPRQLAHCSGTHYFELVKHGRDWQKILEEQAVALHVAGSFTGLTLRLWGLRDR